MDDRGPGHVFQVLQLPFTEAQLFSGPEEESALAAVDVQAMVVNRMRRSGEGLRVQEDGDIAECIEGRMHEVELSWLRQRGSGFQVTRGQAKQQAPWWLGSGGLSVGH